MSNGAQCTYKPNPFSPRYCYEISWERMFRDKNTNTKWEVNEFPVRISRLTTKEKAKAFCEKHKIPFPVSGHQNLQRAKR